MCQNQKQESCQKPENLKGRPEDCSPEQIRKCHGDAGEHPCTAKRDASASSDASTQA